jgi:hypothetical protein
MTQVVPVPAPPPPPSPAAKKNAKSAKIAESASIQPYESTGQSSRGSKRASVSGGGGERRKSVVVGIRNQVRNRMLESGWYDSPGTIAARRFLRGKFFGHLMLLALFVALFFPDMWTCLAMETNAELDIILSVIMGLFLIEFVGLTLTDPSYLLSFFFYMDFIGTASMIMDISYMLGPDASEPVYLKGSAEDARQQIIVVRAARAAKLGARAGRLSRVLKVLRFLPFIGSSQTADSPKVAKVISNQLTNVLSTRVACLTIVLVVILPIFGMFTFPEDDYSMRAWAQLLTLNAQRYDMSTEDEQHDSEYFANMLTRELQRFARFYSGLTYGPFDACLGAEDENEVFVCEKHWTGWDPTFYPPGRMSSRLLVPADRFQVAFDLSGPLQFEAGMGICLICCVIVIMCLFGLFLSSSVSQIALVPLERMLSTVRGIAKQIFKYTAELQDDDEEGSNGDEEYDDIEQSSEFELLEKVVKKLATMAELTANKNDFEVTEGMRDEDVGIIQQMCQTPAATTHRGALKPEDAVAMTARKSRVPAPGQIEPRNVAKVSELGISAEDFDSWHLDPLEMNKPTRIALSQWIVSHHNGCQDFVREYVDKIKLNKFVTACENQYMPNPYHNHSHSTDVEHAVSRMLKLVHADLFLSELEQFSLCISALAHDLGHPGLNNPFLIETQHDLALRYNDKSPLENMHCAKMFELVNNTDMNIFEQMEKEQYKEIRKICIEAILHTDMVQHFEMVKELGMMYQMHSDIFDTYDPDADEPDYDESFASAENKKLAINMFLHTSDVGNPCHPWKICSKWAWLVLDEFFAQGDQEKALGIPVQMLNDRDKVNKPNSQIGFIEFLVTPLITSAVKLFPALYELSDNLGENLQKWEEVWKQESAPMEEEADKVRGRVRKVVNALDEAKSPLMKDKALAKPPAAPAPRASKQQPPGPVPGKK